MTRTNGNVIIEDIKVGDIHYEFKRGYCIKSEVISLPIRSEAGYWSWKSKHTVSGEIIDYGVAENYLQYSPNIYDHEEYSGCQFI